jgi:hypothetical protein
MLCIQRLLFFFHGRLRLAQSCGQIGETRRLVPGESATVSDLRRFSGMSVNTDFRQWLRLNLNNFYVDHTAVHRWEKAWMTGFVVW